MTTDGPTIVIARAFKRIVRRKAQPAVTEGPRIVLARKAEPRQPEPHPATEARAFFTRMVQPPNWDE